MFAVRAAGPIRSSALRAPVVSSLIRDLTCQPASYLRREAWSPSQEEGLQLERDVADEYIFLPNLAATSTNGAFISSSVFRLGSPISIDVNS